ncbi:PorT family protein [Pedobacter polaris]|uniref:PorT family protein n=1 Tax=Pedobacter polaris TaxID=2571273 RepID=A0A4U1CST2_9SPHI|nr:porin family protein [Pedobacter polaris]TKC12181.1 PorT family protein [Pedobacter polaris]
MKKTVTAILFILFTLNLYAQQNAGPNYGFRLGLTAHPTFGFIKAEGGKGNGVNLGFSYGLIGDFNFAENYSFSTGLTITTINGKSTEINPSQYLLLGSAPTSAYDIKYMMQYVEIPLTIKLKTSEINGVRWFGQFGLSNDIRISSREDAKTGNTVVSEDVNSSDWTRFYRAGLIIGGGGEFNVGGKTSIMAGVTLNNGFTNITTNSYTVKNHYVALNLGVFF